MCGNTVLWRKRKGWEKGGKGGREEDGEVRKESEKEEETSRKKFPADRRVT